MDTLIQIMLPEIVLIVVACFLFLLGAVNRTGARKAAAGVAVAALLAVFYIEFTRELGNETLIDEPLQSFRVYKFAQYVKMITAGVGILLALLAWPTNRDGTGNAALEYGRDAGEFFALMLLAIAGVFITAGANDMILLFMGIELASIPTYIMVALSRPLPAAQEAGVKYFFLGAMAAALMLFGFSYLYGAFGTTRMYDIIFRLSVDSAQRTDLGTWVMLGSVMLIAGIAFKIAAVPLHFYAGDVYQGAATPVTAFLSFVPKISGFVALIRVLQLISGGNWYLPEYVEGLLWVLAVLTMTVGNVLGLLQLNVKRLLAYSSIAHTGYMLVGLATMAALQGGDPARRDAFQGVLFYLAAYGIMNTAAFGVLMLLPSRTKLPTMTAETFEDLAGQGRRHPALGLAMAVACLSLIGIPLTVGFFGKFMLIKPAISAAMARPGYGPDGNSLLLWLAIITVVNAAISAAYYLRIIGTMFLREPAPDYEAEPVSAAATETAATAPAAAPLAARPALAMPTPIVLAIVLSVVGTLAFGTVLPMTQALLVGAEEGTRIERDDFAPIMDEYRAPVISRSAQPLPPAQAE